MMEVLCFYKRRARNGAQVRDTIVVESKSNETLLLDFEKEIERRNAQWEAKAERYGFVAAERLIDCELERYMPKSGKPVYSEIIH